MRSLLVGLAVATGCSFGVDSQSAPPDASVDAHYNPPPGPDPNCTQGVPFVQVSCSSDAARVSRYRYYMGGGTHSMCAKIEQQDMVTCSAGCTLGVIDSQLQGSAPDLLLFTGTARVLCAETAEAKVGDACDASGTHPCLPTRATLANDGTVAAMTYLKCGTAGTCETTTPPTIANYLQACDATLVAMYGTTGANGYVDTSTSACLIAWDSSTQSAASGVTRICVGDWQCPSGSLCDDELTTLNGMSTDKSVCKPGPRGTLTPSMLSPAP